MCTTYTSQYNTTCTTYTSHIEINILTNNRSIVLMGLTHQPYIPFGNNDVINTVL